MVRSCANEASPEPELRSSPASADIPELDVSLALPCSEKGGETMTHSPVTTRSPMGEDTPSDGIQSDDTTPASEHMSSVTVEEGSQGLNQSYVPEGNKLHGTIKEATPVALRTRSRLQTAPIIIDEREGEVRQTDCDRDYELILPFMMQIKKQQGIIDEMKSAVQNFLKVQSIVKKLQGTITKPLESQKKFKVTIQHVVKPLTQVNNSLRARDAEELMDTPRHHSQKTFKISLFDTIKGTIDFPDGYATLVHSPKLTQVHLSSDARVESFLPRFRLTDHPQTAAS